MICVESFSSCILIVLCHVSTYLGLFFSFKVYFSSKLNIIDACVVIVTLVVTMVYTFSDLSGPSLIPRYMFAHCIPITTGIQLEGTIK